MEHVIQIYDADNDKTMFVPVTAMQLTKIEAGDTILASQLLDKWKFATNTSSSLDEPAFVLNQDNIGKVVCSAQDRYKEKEIDNIDNTVIWTTNRLMERDIEATELFIQLRKQLQERFDDKNTKKDHLWQKIVNEMQKYGYNLDLTPITKLKQKFINLGKMYLNHNKHMKKTGEETKQPPNFYNEMHDLIGYKDKFSPKGLIDSLHTPAMENSSVESSAESSQQCSTTADDSEDTVDVEHEVKNGFKTKRQPRDSTGTRILHILEAQQKEIQQHFLQIEKHFRKQSEDRERLLSILERLIPTKE